MAHALGAMAWVATGSLRLLGTVQLAFCVDIMGVIVCTNIK